MALQVPLIHFLEYALSIPLNDVSMARDNPIKIPTPHSLGTRVEGGLVFCRCIPYEAFLPYCAPLRVLEDGEKFRKDPTSCKLASLRVLLRSGEVEHQICLDQGPVWLVKES